MNVKDLQMQVGELSLLYVEDEIELQERTAMFFRKLFKSVDTANDGEEGVELFSQNHYDVIITDLKMPKLGGKAMLEEIKKISSDVVTVVMSGLSNSDGEEEDIECDIFLEKPVEMSNLIATLEEVVKLVKDRTAK